MLPIERTQFADIAASREQGARAVRESDTAARTVPTAMKRNIPVKRSFFIKQTD